MPSTILNNKYCLRKIIGRGIYGEVWLATDEYKNKYAIKIQSKKEEDILRISKKEKKYLELVKNNPNFVKIVDSFEDNEYVFIVLEYYENNLRDYINYIPKFNLCSRLFYVKRWIYQILKGLNYLNSLGYGHFDIKPENLLLNKDLDIKICDLGLVQKPENITKNQECQSSYYRAPEAIETHLCDIEPKVNFRSDIWSIGCLMAEIIMGIPLFYEIDSKSLKKQQNEGAITRYNRKVYPLIFKELNKIALNYEKINELFGDEGIYTKYISLLQGCLEHNFEKRISVEKAIEHSFFL